MKRITFASLAVLGASLLPSIANAQPRVYTAADYEHAEKFMTYNTDQLVFRATVRPNWLADERFWYQDAQPDGSTEYILADPAKGTHATAFNHVALAAALARAAGSQFDAKHLQLTNLDFSPDASSVEFNAAGKRYKCDTHGSACVSTGNAIAAAPGAGGGRGGRGGRGGGGGRGAATGRPPETLSPDGKRGVFIRDYNLWVRETATGQEKQLTKDGVKDFGYATDNAGWQTSDRAIVVWSPDSKKIATFQQDQRKVGEMYLVNTQVGHPQLKAWKYPLPGDNVVTMIEPVIIDTETGSMERVKLPPQQHRSTLCDDVACRGGEWADLQWGADGNTLAYVSTSRDHKREVLHIIEAATGSVRDVLTETVEDAVRIGQRRGELEVSAGVARVHLVLRERQLGPPLSLQFRQWPVEKPDHQG